MITIIIILSIALVSLSVILFSVYLEKENALSQIHYLEKQLNQQINKVEILTDKLCETRKDLMISQGQRWLCESLSKNKSND